MKEEMQAALMSLLTQAIDAAQRGAEFLAGEIPDVIQQLLMWKLIEASFYPLMWLLLLVIPIMVFLRTPDYTQQVRDKKEEYRNSPHNSKEERIFRIQLEDLQEKKELSDTLHAGAFIVGGMLFLLFVVAIFMFIPDILKITFTPKLYLIEYGMRLVK